MQRKINVYFNWSALGCFLSAALHFQRQIDLQVQALFFSNGHWLIDENEPIGKLFFYRGPKIVLAAFGAVLLLYWLWLRFQHKKSNWFRMELYVLICLLVVPALIALGKIVTNEPCPKELYVFGGPLLDFSTGGRCFPGGHASGFFSLFSLYWASRKKTWGLSVGLFFGSVFGIYQMAKGAHFLSDTLFTAFFSWWVCQLIFHFYQKGFGQRSANRGI